MDVGLIRLGPPGRRGEINPSLLGHMRQGSRQVRDQIRDITCGYIATWLSQTRTNLSKSQCVMTSQTRTNWSIYFMERKLVGAL